MAVDREKLLGDGLDTQSELGETKRALREITLLIEQSQGELTKLGQRNAAITAHLQQVQGKLDQMTPQEIRMAYDAALDAQQRLFVMHGQLEKLQSDKTHLEKYKKLLQQSGNAAAAPTDGAAALGPGKSPMAEIEMIVNRRRPSARGSHAKCMMARPRQCRTSSCRRRSPCACWMQIPCRPRRSLRT